MLCVPDAEIAAAAETLTAAAPLVGHTSGATPLSALAHAGVPAFGLHPLQSFAHPGVRFEGAGAAVAGSTPEALAFATALAERLGMKPFEIDDEGRAAYHAAASVASNFLVTLQAAAETIASGAGLGRDDARALLMPLVRQTVENVAELGPGGRPHRADRPRRRDHRGRRSAPPSRRRPRSCSSCSTSSCGRRARSPAQRTPA